ncbi:MULTISPECIES: hypothetical protein [unclassified Mesorhizobium]|uniref:hypothetical protein n=1 Tax=unclassified Mesorhizobium TaxID=325217 RepID=UPI001FDFC2DD|nr:MULTISPECIES: hypothetical protein [unclassified Mesorhizobium]
MIRERTTTGLAQARAKGRIGGAPQETRREETPGNRRKCLVRPQERRRNGGISEPTVSRVDAEHRHKTLLPTSHDLKGLMKFLARDEWRDPFEEIFDDHFGPVLEAGDMEFEDIAEILGDDWAMTLWGCAFEDFLTQDFGGGNIVDAYLRRRGWKENAQAKAYMKALRTSIMSLYEVSDIVPGKSLMARDLVRGGEPLAVSEGTATKTLKQWGQNCRSHRAGYGQKRLCWWPVAVHTSWRARSAPVAPLRKPSRPDPDALPAVRHFRCRAALFAGRYQSPTSIELRSHHILNALSCAFASKAYH